MSTEAEIRRAPAREFINLKAILRKQPMMRRVLISLVPIILFSTWLFGLRVLSVIAVVTVAGIITEYYFEKSRGGKPTESIIVSCFLYSLILPATIPYWIAIVGIVFAVIFGKQVFGGFGKNVFNPALVGRCFVFITFPGAMTNNWVMPFSGFPGGLLKWIPETVDGMTRATPLVTGGEVSGISNILMLFFGNVSGSMGETSAFLIIIAGVYLIYKKTASWKTMISVLTGVLLMETLLFLIGVSKFPDPITALFSGGVMFGIVFMATDPVSSPSKDGAKIVYGLLVGILAAVIREFSLFPEGMMFAILVMNSFVPLMDIVAKSMKRRAKA